MASTADQLEAAIALAVAAHRGQRYPSPEREPYVCHPLRVMQAMGDFDARIAAVLHDVLEDTALGVADLRILQLEAHVIGAVLALTRGIGEPYADYIERVRADPLARRVKLADLSDNVANNLRLPQRPDVVERLARYRSAQLRLS